MCEAVVWIQITGVWEQCYARLGGNGDDTGRLFRVMERVRLDLAASASNCSAVIAQFEVCRGLCEVRPTTVSMAALSKLLKSKEVPPTPCFWNAIVLDLNHSEGKGVTYRFCSASEEERSMWLNVMNALCNDGKPSRSPPLSPLRKIKTNKNLPKILTARPQPILHKSPTARKDNASPRRKDGHELFHLDPHPDDLNSPNGVYNKRRGPGSVAAIDTFSSPDDLEEIQNDGVDETKLRICGFRMPSALEFLLVASAYPLAVIFLVFRVTQNKNLHFMRSVWFVWPVNGALAYGLPIVLVDVVLQTFVRKQWVQRLTVGLFCTALAAMSLYVSYFKVSALGSTAAGLEEGTFSFKPSRRVRWTLGNGLQLAGVVLDWLLNCTMVLPQAVLGLFPTETALSAVPPYLPFDVYFWTAFSLALFCSMVVLLNSALRGAMQYRLRHTKFIWHLFNSVSGGGVFFLSILIIMLMSLQCNYQVSPSAPLLLQSDPTMGCYSNEHIMRARAGAVALCVFFIQSSLLPGSTFKESLLEDQDITYPLVYLSLQTSLQLASAYFFVFFYQEESARIVSISLLNAAQLAANHILRPCSVSWVNTLRDVLFLHACLSSVFSLNLLSWGPGPVQQHATAALSLSTLVSTALFTVLGGAMMQWLQWRSAEHAVASAFLEVEYQVAHASGVSPRALEQLIGLTQSTDKNDWAVCKKYIAQLVFLLNYNSLRVQFQAAWALANIALLDEDARIKIHEANGTAALQESYGKMQPMAQLETLAALANLTLSPRIADELAKQNNCIPFFMELVRTQRQDRTMHCVFACIALGNLARNETFRDIIRRQGGVQALVRCIMSHHYQKRKYGMLALANMALSPVPEVQRLFRDWPGLLDRVVKTASSNELDTQREVVALIRNLAAHSQLRPVLLDKGVMAVMHNLRNSPLDEVTRCVEELSQSIERELATTGVARVVAGFEADEAAADAAALKKLNPLDARVDWSTWGSKLDSLFEPIFAQAPTPVNMQLEVVNGEPVLVCLANSLTKDTVSRWADTLSFIVTRQPSHGVLKQASSSHFWTYAPSLGYSGSDVFSFRVVLGSAVSSAARCEITIEQDLEFADVYPSRGGFSSSFRRASDEHEDDDAADLDKPIHEDDYFDERDDDHDGKGEMDKV